MQFGIIGSGSWATALAKILTDNGNTIYWHTRNVQTIHHIQQRRHNPHYLSSAYFNTAQLQLTDDIDMVVANSEVILIAVPSAYIVDVLMPLEREAFEGKKIISAIKGILPTTNQLLNDYLSFKQIFKLNFSNLKN
jgi:glycerol-3-phosphate dehydrogenase (NAD(P)+)